MADLNPKKERFAQLYVELGNASEAYRQSHNSKAKPESVHVRACELMRDSNVLVRIKELRAELEEQSLWSRTDSLKVLADIAKGVDAEAKPSDKVNAVKVINSMHGWDKQIVEQTTTHHLSESLAERLTGGSKR